MVTTIKVILSMERDMGKVNVKTKMARIIKEIMKMISLQEKASTNGKTMKVTKAIGKTDYSMARVLKNLLMEQFLMAVGS